MLSFFKKKKTEDSVEAKKNWYEDRYQNVVVQRNFVVLVILLSLGGILISTISVIKVTSSKKIEPFVIEIEEKTGITNVIRPLLKEQFAYDEVIKNYFLVKYIKAREEYRPSTFEYKYYTVVRLLSDASTYNNFRRYISSNGPDTPSALGDSTRTIKIISMTQLKSSTGYKGQTYQIRFSAMKPARNRVIDKKNYVATINFDFFDLSLTREERSVNPLGFQVIGYSLDEEIL